MKRASYLQDLLGAILETGVSFAGYGTRSSKTIQQLCTDLLSVKGEASGTRMAGEILSLYKTLSKEEKAEFFQFLSADFDLYPNEIITAAQAYAETQHPKDLAALLLAAEPSRQNLLRHLNMVPGGTAELVRMRAELLPLLNDHPELQRLDIDFQHLFASWFNRGFLVLRPIDWETPVYLLDKIIEYEAVHAIPDFEELRKRLQPEDRRCFAFFHPAMPDEPLIFVEVALTQGLASSIQAVLSDDREVIAATDATTANFYSISNCQVGLRGVSFGNFLIKQVANDLMAELPNLKTFTTLSPIPGFGRWLSKAADEGDAAAVYGKSIADKGETLVDLTEDSAEAKVLQGLMADYFLNQKRSDGKPVDSVSRFHLGNGAKLSRINWLGDTTEKGLQQSAGMMVNYVYDLDSVEENHETFAATGDVRSSRAVRGLTAHLDRFQRDKKLMTI